MRNRKRAIEAVSSCVSRCATNTEAMALHSPSSRKKACADMNFSSTAPARAEPIMKIAFMTLLAAITWLRRDGSERCCMMALSGTA